MASRNYGRPAAHSPELVDLSDSEELLSEELISISEEEPTQRELNDHRLTQAISYLAEEGGDDSPATFIDRVDRIDEALIQQLPQQGRDFDTTLYRRARAMVRDVQRDFEEAAQQASTSILDAEESEEDLPQYYTPSAAQALHRAEENLFDDVDIMIDEDMSEYEDSMKGAQAIESLAKDPETRPLTRQGKDKDVDRTRRFKYGGLDNEYENWHKDFPAVLPFPETIQMAHWESIKIDYELSESGKQEKASGEVVETNIPFNIAALQQYKKLPLYDSGSRFTLPTPIEDVQKQIERLGTPQKLRKVVEEFNVGDRKVELAKDYAPRMFLQQLEVGNNQVIPTEIRRALARTPTKPRSFSTSKAGATSSTPVPPAPDLGTSAKTGKTSAQTGATTRERFINATNAARSRPTTTVETPSKQTPGAKQPDSPPSAISDFNKAVRNGFTTQEEATNATTHEQRSALARRIAHTIEEALKTSPTPRQPPSPRVIIPVKRGRGRPRKGSSPQKPETAVTCTTRSSTTKRKRSIGGKTYTPERQQKKRVSFAGSVDSEEEMLDIINVTPVRKKTKPTVVEISSEEESLDDLALLPPQPKRKFTPVKPAPVKPATPAKSTVGQRKFNRLPPEPSTVATKITRSKAAAAAAQVRKAK